MNGSASKILGRLGGVILALLPAFASRADGAPDSPQPPAPLRTLYVNPDGNDTSPGTAQMPWRSLQRAASAARPGDLIHVARGQYAGFVLGWDAPQSGTAAAPIVFQAEPGATIVMRNGKSADAINLETASFVVIDGFSIDNARGTISRAGIRSVKNDGVVIRNNTVDKCGTWGIFTSHSEHVTIENNIASNSKTQHGIYVSNSADEPVIRGNRIFGNRMCGLHINGDGSQGGDGVISRALVENNIIFDNGRAGGSAINCDGVQDSRIQNNLLYDNHANGISLFQADGSAPATGNLVVNNTMIMAADARWAVNIKNKSTGNALYNNILCNENPARGAINIAADSRAGFRSDYNAVDGDFSADDDEIVSLGRWQSLTQQDAHSLRTSIRKLFVNHGGRDFHLAAGSPAIRAGASLPAPREAPANDIEHTPRPEGENPDLGAYEAARPLKAVAMGMAGGMAWGAWFMAALLVLGCGLGALGMLKRRGLNRWLWPYLRHKGRRRPCPPNQPVHVLLCIADHFEPHNGGVPLAQANARVACWVRQYPALLGRFHDADGRPPRHTFFYPVEQYNQAHVEALAGLCRQGFGEVEIHLHHSHDTPENLRRVLLESKRQLAQGHGLLARRRDTGEIVYGFVHGDWALGNPHRDGSGCGVDNELEILRETGCYADFTFPSAPSQTQPPTINRIYYADCARPHGHERGCDLGGGALVPQAALLLIQGPLLLNWRQRKAGVLPRIENACLQANQPPTMERLDLWLRAGVQVPARPDWYFVKLHTHGAPEANQAVLLGPAMVQFHQALAQRARRDRNFHFHYVTARELYNLVQAAQAGWTGSVNDARDFALPAPAPASPPTHPKAHVIFEKAET